MLNNKSSSCRPPSRSSMYPFGLIDISGGLGLVETSPSNHYNGTRLFDSSVTLEQGQVLIKFCLLGRRFFGWWKLARRYTAATSIRKVHRNVSIPSRECWCLSFSQPLNACLFSVVIPHADPIYAIQLNLRGDN